MSNVTKTICDRCGAEIVYHGWTTKFKRNRPTRFKLLRLFNGNPDGYSYSEREYELCNHCTFELDRFLKGE